MIKRSHQYYNVPNYQNIACEMVADIRINNKQ